MILRPTLLISGRCAVDADMYFIHHVDNLILCKVKIDYKTCRDLLQMIKVESDIPDGELLDPLDKVSEILSDACKHIHIIVQHPHGVCGFLFSGDGYTK
jgi:hypothetical protein